MEREQYEQPSRDKSRGYARVSSLSHAPNVEKKDCERSEGKEERKRGKEKNGKKKKGKETRKKKMEKFESK